MGRGEEKQIDENESVHKNHNLFSKKKLNYTLDLTLWKITTLVSNVS